MVRGRRNVWVTIALSRRIAMQLDILLVYDSLLLNGMLELGILWLIGMLVELTLELDLPLVGLWGIHTPACHPSIVLLGILHLLRLQL